MVGDREFLTDADTSVVKGGMRRLWRLALAAWVAAFASLALFYSFWRLEYVAPHGGWALGTLAIVGGLSFALCLAGLWRFAFGPARLLAVGIALVGTTPAVWWSLYIADAAHRAETRASLRRYGPLRIAAIWISSVMDAEARWRYGRWTEGRHAVLLDSGSLDAPQELVGAMDAHIMQMATLLGEPVPQLPTRWVRGPLVGEKRGRAIISWAIAPAHTTSTELTTLDRHEAAHTLITLMSGVDQDPPTLLAEGWAEYQSADRDEQLRRLIRLRQVGDNESLDELVSMPMYDRSIGPAYTHGGPFARYLIERLGGPKFLDLYRGVRAETFSADVERIAAVSWPRLQTDFWDWVDDRATRFALEEPAVKPAGEKPPAWKGVELADGVDPFHWQFVAEGYLRTALSRPLLPTDAAVVFTTAAQSTYEGVVKERVAEFQAVFRGDSIWCKGREVDGATDYLMITPQRSAELLGARANSQAVTELQSDRIPWAAVDLWRFHVTPTIPELWLPLGNRAADKDWRIQLIQPQVGGETRWTVMATRPHPGGAVRTTAELDAEYDWQVCRKLVEYPDGSRATMVAKLDRVGGCVAPVQSQSTFADGGKARCTMRVMSPEEEAALRDEVATALQPAFAWPAMFTRPITYAAAWPLVGLALIGADGLSRRLVREAAGI